MNCHRFELQHFSKQSSALVLEVHKNVIAYSFYRCKCRALFSSFTANITTCLTPMTSTIEEIVLSQF